MDVWVARLQEELDGGYQIARFSPLRRRHLGYLDYYATAADQLDIAVRDTCVLVRAAVTLVREKKGVAPGPLAEATLEFALAVKALAGHLKHSDDSLDDARDLALGAAGKATSVFRSSHDLETSALVSQVRSTAIDLLQVAGMDSSEALESLREATRIGSGE